MKSNHTWDEGLKTVYLMELNLFKRFNSYDIIFCTGWVTLKLGNASQVLTCEEDIRYSRDLA